MQDVQRAGNRELAIGAAMACVGVVLGAFGAHALKETLELNGEQFEAAWHTATQYQMYGAFGLIACGLAAPRFRCQGVRIASWLLGLGTVLFSGSLYILAVSKITKFGMVTPFGGLLLILGFITLTLTAWNSCGSSGCATGIPLEKSQTEPPQ
ncbi:MAG: DUF423 domain-containing protein [Planctomycetales bacterium]|nr:DUF423 domain-containing protein [Planctomycetales bacterium]